MSRVSQLPWNRPLVQQLLKLAAEEKLGHAYLFQGPAGIGKLSALMDFAEQLFCQNPQQGKACGECQGCRLFQAGTHPDFRTLQAEEGAVQIKIEQVRSSQTFIANTPMMGKYKILLIKPAESLNINAANALLKNLEEPAPGTLMFLLSHQPGALLATIRSRCQQIKFALPAPEQSLDFLRQHLADDQARQALALSRGAPLKALTLAQEDRLQEISAIHSSLLDLFNKHISITEAAAGWENIDDDLLLESLLTVTDFLLRSMQQAQDDDSELAASTALSTLLQAFGGEQIPRLHEFYQELIRTRAMLKSRANPNRQLLLESLCLQWVKLLTEAASKRKMIA